MRADIDRPLFFFGRPLDSRAPEPANGVTIAFDVPTCRRADVPTCRRADVPTCRRADVPTCRRIDTPTHRHTDTPTHRHTDTPTHRHTDTPTPAHVASHPALALPSGGTCKRPPRQHPHIAANDYGTHFRDPHGNDRCAVRHRPTRRAVVRIVSIIDRIAVKPPPQRPYADNRHDTNQRGDDDAPDD
ncbi:hypothetical protein [Burkholderia dolosa]|uniref:hypothetical protein n=1 Tax=Burkholderia dolosa TaxID=152500 RepID=UPI0020136869|nr:hypothetical protein [Burkholderia dolosa]